MKTGIRLHFPLPIILTFVQNLRHVWMESWQLQRQAGVIAFTRSGERFAKAQFRVSSDAWCGCGLKGQRCDLLLVNGFMNLHVKVNLWKLAWIYFAPTKGILLKQRFHWTDFTVKCSHFKCWCDRSTLRNKRNKWQPNLETIRPRKQVKFVCTGM